MCAKRQRRCQALLEMREEALAEWAGAESIEEVRAAWSRLGGRVTLHRYGSEHFSLMARARWGDPEALVLLAARMAYRGRSAR